MRFINNPFDFSAQSAVLKRERKLFPYSFTSGLVYVHIWMFPCKASIPATAHSLKNHKKR